METPDKMDKLLIHFDDKYNDQMKKYITIYRLIHGNNITPDFDLSKSHEESMANFRNTDNYIGAFFTNSKYHFAIEKEIMDKLISKDLLGNYNKYGNINDKLKFMYYNLMKRIDEMIKKHELINKLHNKNISNIINKSY